MKKWEFFISLGTIFLVERLILSAGSGNFNVWLGVLWMLIVAFKEKDLWSWWWPMIIGLSWFDLWSGEAWGLLTFSALVTLLILGGVRRVILLSNRGIVKTFLGVLFFYQVFLTVFWIVNTTWDNLVLSSLASPVFISWPFKYAYVFYSWQPVVATALMLGIYFIFYGQRIPRTKF